MTGALVVLGLGLVALALAASRDRHTRLAAEQAMAQAPERAGLDQAPTPSYVTPPDADTVRDLPELDASQLAAWTQARTDGEVFALRLVDERFATSPGRLGLADALVVGVSEPVASIRELLPCCTAAIKAGRPLVVAAPEVAPAVVTTLVVNLYRNSLTAAVLVGGADECARLAVAAGGQPVTRAQLQSGLGPDSFAGRASRLVADEQGCSLVREA